MKGYLFLSLAQKCKLVNFFNNLFRRKFKEKIFSKKLYRTGKVCYTTKVPVVQGFCECGPERVSDRRGAKSPADRTAVSFNFILSGMRPWRSWIARQTPTFLTTSAEIRRKALQTGALADRQRKKRRELTTV